MPGFFSPDPIQTFIKKYYPDLSLHPQMLAQLSWLQGNSVTTSQANTQATTDDDVNPEIKRCLARLYCLKQLEFSPFTLFDVKPRNFFQIN